MVLRKGPLGAVGGYHRRAQCLRQADNLVGAAQHLHLLADHYRGPLGLENQLEGLLHQRRIALGHSRVPGPQNLHVGAVPQQVGGQLQLYRTRATILKPLKGLHEIVRNGLHLADHGVPVGHGLEHPQLVLGLVGGIAALPQELRLHVGGHLQERRAGEIGLAHRAQRVRGARSGAGYQDTGLAGGAGVSVRHEPASQLKPPADEAQAVLPFEERVE